jgi:hypothetical protein
LLPRPERVIFISGPVRDPSADVDDAVTVEKSRLVLGGPSTERSSIHFKKPAPLSNTSSV